MPVPFKRARNLNTGTVTVMPDPLITELTDWVEDIGPAPTRPKPRKLLGSSTARRSQPKHVAEASAHKNSDKE